MDDTKVKKALNKAKTSARKRQGPVRKDQDMVPVADAMRDYWDRGMLAFGIPAHNGGRGPAPEFSQWLGPDAARCDLPMSHGMDTRDRAWGVVSTAQELFADAVGAKQTLFSTNGSSMSVHVAVMTVAGPGETLVMARNGHKSSFAALVMSGARPVYVDPYYDEELEIALGPLTADLAGVLDEHPDARAALLFTPSYYGTSADVRGLAEARRCCSRASTAPAASSSATASSCSSAPSTRRTCCASGSRPRCRSCASSASRSWRRGRASRASIRRTC